MLPFLPWSADAASPQLALVVVDLRAREEGYALELEGMLLEGEVLPVDVAEGERVRVVDPDGGRHPLDVAAGEAWVVAGPFGDAWMARISEDVRADAVLVRGDGEAVRNLAEALGATVHTDDGALRLEAPHLLSRLPWAEAEGLDRLDEVAWAPVSAPVVAPPPPARAELFAARAEPRASSRGITGFGGALPPAGSTSDDDPRPEPPVERPGPRGAYPVVFPVVIPPELGGSVFAVGHRDAGGACPVAWTSNWRCGGESVSLSSVLTFPGHEPYSARGEWWAKWGSHRHLVARDATLAEATEALRRDGCPIPPGDDQPEG